MTGAPAAFLDRDGTVIRDANYVRDPADVALLPDAAGAIRRLNARGIPVIVVTNQSGIARGYLNENDYERVRHRLDVLLNENGARIDATYMCPHYPTITGPCDCRKPGLELYRRAMHDHSIDPKVSLFAGDRWRDVQPGIELGGTAILLDVESTPPEDRTIGLERGVPFAHSLAEAVARFLSQLPPTGESP